MDTDGDGMPDEWEIANGLNPGRSSDANKDCTGDGYTNIEKYINGISTKHKVDWRDLKITTIYWLRRKINVICNWYRHKMPNWVSFGIWYKNKMK